MVFDANSNKMLLIAGPCSLESKDLSFKVAETVAEIADKYKSELTVLFKGSFDKANRTSIKGNRGTGMRIGLEILADVKKEFSLPVITDVHESCQCEQVGEVCDALQIPAFLCRQTD
ncbi:MAG: 3-deoxy-8-phosphooctulonate synthase, partial [Eubacteriales bacterium]|nr:3-deoxy-8-phosphooctulonate synthase [Eubacteriales bacterium]